MPSTVDRISDYFVDRYVHIKARLARSAPKYLHAEIDPFRDTGSQFTLGSREQTIDAIFGGMSPEQIQKAFLAISWIYADIDLMAREAASIDMHVTKRLTDQKRIDVQGHPFEKLIKRPNPFMSKTFMMRFLIYWINISEMGAFWFLTPDKNDPDSIVEIWPMKSSRVEPIKDPNHYVRYFQYTSGSGQDRKKILIDAKYVCWFRYPDPFDYWKSLPPLRAAMLPGEIELGIQKSQRKFYVDSRGIPMSIVSLDPNISEPDYEMAREQIKNDWENEGTTVAIARGGTIDIKSLGFTQRDLEILGSQDVTKDKIDSIFFGFPLRSAELVSGEGLKQIDKLIKEKTIYPLHKLIAEQLTLAAIHPFFEGEREDLECQFDDVRTTDRALTIQENNVKSRWYSVNEMRQIEGEAPIEVEKLPGIGDLPVMLATNSAFVAQLYEIGPVNAGHQEKPDDVGNLTNSQDSRSLTNQMARNDTKPPSVLQKMNSDPVFAEAAKAELKRWRTVARRSFEKDNDATAREFTSDILDNEFMDMVNDSLKSTIDVDGINFIFEPYIANGPES